MGQGSQFPANFFGAAGGGGVVAVGAEHDELFTAVAGHHVARAALAFQQSGERGEDFVSGLMSVGVVGAFEMIEVGQIVEADFISPDGTVPSGLYKVKIKHITKLDKKEHRGHQLVGLSILKKLDN